MTRSRPHATPHATMVGLGVTIASLVYGASLALQQSVPAVKDMLMVTVADGVRPTYYLRVTMSLIVGAIAAGLGRRLRVSERSVAIGTAIAIGLFVVLVCVFP